MTTIAVSTGDPQGIGPEITILAIQRRLAESAGVRFIVVGPAADLAGRRRTIESDRVEWIDLPFTPTAPPPSAEAGRVAFGALERAVDLCLAGRADALVTAPLSKEAVAKTRPGFTGHTEYLGERTGERPLMMLASDTLRVTLATVHCALSDVPRRITRERIGEAIADTQRGVAAFFGIERPKVAVLALNPHAGEGGELGREEIETIAPAIFASGGEANGIFGPFSADSFFVPGRYDRFDVTLAMYHDQGLIPLKALGFGRSVNVTLGLSIVRVSPDHGTAFPIAGKGVADPSSMALALAVAEDAVNRRRSRRA